MSVCVRARESRDKEDLIFIDQTVDMGGFRKIGMITWHGHIP